MIINKIKNNGVEKYRELLLYFLFGVSTTLVNILIYQGLLWSNVDYKVANLCAVILGKIYAYITNKKFVFKSKCNSFRDTVKEFFRFVYARGITGLVDYFGLIVAIEFFDANQIIMKYILQVIIIILNYIFSKLIVFKSKSNR